MNAPARLAWIALLLPVVGLTAILADNARGQAEARPPGPYRKL